MPWGVLGSPGVSLGAPWDVLGIPEGRLGCPREPLGTSLGVLDGPLELLGVPLGRFGWFCQSLKNQGFLLYFQIWRHPWVTLGRVWCDLGGCWALGGNH